MTHEPGQQLLHYRLVQKIGEGGMGVVWKAEDTKLHRHVALKVLPQSMAADPDRRARFEREARAVAALNHPNIVTLHSVEKADGVHFITMELVDGQNLAQLLPRGGFPLSRLLEIAIPLADAVSRAHRAGITHRDLKPDNVMIDADGRLRVLDFGLAKLQEPAGSTPDTMAATVTSDTAEGRVLGTAAYMSPEQAEGREVDARSDIFSLGTILYEMATGARPFQGETTMSMIGAILKDEPRTITELKPSLPRHAGRIVRRCLAKDPDRRYQTALDLRNELEELKSESEADDAGPSGSAEAAHPQRGRSWILGAVAVIAIGAAIAIWISSRREAPPPVTYEPRPVTATTGWDKGPSWSPDGKYIAISRMVSGHVDVYVLPVDGGDAVLRADGPGDQNEPRWSPDGRYLAYLSTGTPGYPVFLIPPDGGRSRMLIETNLPTLSLVSLLGDRPWSLDGRTLLVPRILDTGQLALHRVDVETREATQITFPPTGLNDLLPTYSFDGNRIVFLRGSMAGKALMMMPAEGGEPETLWQGGVEWAAWRPDNRHVLFVTSDDTRADLVELDVATGKTRTIYDDPSIVSPSVSPDGRIVYADFRHDQFLFAVDVETGERRQITAHSRSNVVPRYSPDGRTIAYASDRLGDFEVWLHDLEDGTETRFTHNEAMDGIAEWSPDGRRLLYMSNRGDDKFRWYVANADGAGGSRLLVDQPIGWQGPFSPVEVGSRWSPDGELIAYVVTGEQGGELWTVVPDGQGARRRLEDITGFDWYRGSRVGLITRLRGNENELLAVDLETGRERSLHIGGLREIDVAPDGSAVAFCFGRGHMSMGLAMVRLEPPSEPDGLPQAIGEPEYVVKTEGTWHVHFGGWSPDSKELAYVRDQDYGDIYELVEK